MGLFGKFFTRYSDDKQDKQLSWITLSDFAQLTDILENSKSKTQLIFKHSTRCGISKMVMNKFIANYDYESNLDLYYLDLIKNRDISNEVGYKFQVVHESPQLLIIKNQVAVAHASHGDVNLIDLSEYV